MCIFNFCWWYSVAFAAKAEKTWLSPLCRQVAQARLSWKTNQLDWTGKAKDVKKCCTSLDCTGIGKSTGWHAHQLLIRLEVNTPTFVILWWKILENPVTYCRFLRALCAKLLCNMICPIGFQNQMASDSRLSGLHGSLSESIVYNRGVQDNDVETMLPHSNLSTRPWGK